VEKEPQTGKRKKKMPNNTSEDKIDKKELFNHVKESCVKDPFYVTKMLLSAFGRNAVDTIVRIAIYVLILFPLLTSVLHIPNGVAYILVTFFIILYYTIISIYRKIVKQIKENGNMEKSLDKDSKGMFSGVFPDKSTK
jgi:hypothetical protein